MTRYEGEEKMKAPDIETISQELEDAILQMENRNERITSVVGPEPEPAVEESAGGTKIRRQPGKSVCRFCLPAKGRKNIEGNSGPDSRWAKPDIWMRG